jgi:hypothetical protein
MLKLVALLLASLLLSVGNASVAGAAIVGYDGTLSFQFRNLTPLEMTGSGLARLNGSPGMGGGLETLTLRGGITDTATAVAPSTTAISDPIFGAPPLTVELEATLGTGALRPISGGGPVTTSTLPVAGTLRVCVLIANCGFAIPIPLTASTPSGVKGVGIGGLLTLNGFGTTLQLAYSVMGAPWTVGTATITGVTTTNGGTGTITAVGFAHGPASGTSTASTSGVVQLVVPVVITSAEIGSGIGSSMGMFGTLVVVVPEPNSMLLLAAAAAGLAAIGLSRRRPRP